MIDMKLNPEQSQNMVGGTLLGAENDAEPLPAYPEGLKVELEGESLKRLAMGEGNLPQVGTRMVLHALVEVIEVCKEDGAIEAEYCVELQITAMELQADEKPLNPQQAAYEKLGKMFA